MSVIVRPYVVVPPPDRFEGLAGPTPITGVLVWASHPRKAALAAGLDGIVLVSQLGKMELHGYTYHVGDHGDGPEALPCEYPNDGLRLIAVRRHA